MSRLFLFFSHKVTEEQEESAKQDLDVSEIVPLPEPLQEKFSNIPPTLPHLKEYAKPILNWFEQECSPGDFALIQGDFGMTFLLVQKAFSLGVTPVYSTTLRKAVERDTPDGEKKIEHYFRHQRFRQYEKLD